MTCDLTTQRVLGAPICAATMRNALDLAEQHIAARQRLLIGVVNAAKLVNMRSDAALRESVQSCDVVFADGMAVVWASRLLGRPLPQRVAGIDLMMELLTRGSERGWRVFCLGATQEVLDGVTREIAQRFPGVQLAGAQHGYFTPAQESAVADAIAASRADILFVAMTSPKKEQFLARWSEHMNVPVCHGVGGSFDVLAGKVRRAPRVWQVLGLEWAYRVAQEPRRLWKRYLITNVKFVWMVLGAMVARCLGRLESDHPRQQKTDPRPTHTSSRPA
ncbi:MAG: N-acetylglucosaminyldiphosphoundecaprenol N-acetyl-beta-D-mannosaminyltransferase [Phycisphaerae bacterium]|nr:N-acetylglucosaminyldiphosphoundecaprenol N-acetyl-beta-D-mannosaminyltransferase [Phycisphaerae bacterium]